MNLVTISYWCQQLLISYKAVHVPSEKAAVALAKIVPPSQLLFVCSRPDRPLQTNLEAAIMVMETYLFDWSCNHLASSRKIVLDQLCQLPLQK